MKRILALVLVAGMAACDSAPQEAPLSAKAEFIDNAGAKVGVALLTEGADGVRIVADLKGLPAGVHAFHIHNNGSCHAGEAKPFDTAGPHFNPFGKKHGLENPDGPHAGDLPNFEAKADGTAHIELVAKLVTLKPGANNSLIREGGTCLMIHAGADDNKSDPAGNAGARWACAVISK